MKKVALALATMGVLFYSCGSKTEADFSIVPVQGSDRQYQYADIAQKGKIVITQSFDGASIFRDGLALVRLDKNYGYIDKKGKFVISPVYNKAQDFNEGTAWVQMEDQPPMLIDKKGKTLLQIDSLTAATPFHNGIALVTLYSKGETFATYIDKKGQPAVMGLEGISLKELPISEDGLYAYMNKNDQPKGGYKNKNGDIIIPEQYDDVSLFIDGMAIVKAGEKWGVINKKGDYLITPQYDFLVYDSDGLFIALIGKKIGWINKKGEVVIQPQYDDVGPFNRSKLAPVQMGKKLAYINRKADLVINPKYETALSFNGNYALVRDNDRIGFIDSKGEYIVHPMFNVGNIDEYVYAGQQNSYGFPIQYYGYGGDKSSKFSSYTALQDKKDAWRESQRNKD